MWPFKKKIEYVQPSVHIKTIDESRYVPSDNGVYAAIITGAKMPLEPVRVFPSPSFPKPRWFQFWRWHLIPEYNRQYKECLKAVVDVYGVPYFKRAENAYLQGLNDASLQSVRIE